MKKVVTVLVLLGLSHVAWAGKIVQPWRSTTAIVKSGETFDVWFDADNDGCANLVDGSGWTTHTILSAAEKLFFRLNVIQP